MKNYKVLKLPHGWFAGYIKEKDVVDTIDATIMYWHTLIVEELADTNELKQRERVLIKNDQNAVEAFDGDGIDLGLNRKNHRGTVKHGISHTIKTEIDCGVIEIENKSDRDAQHKRFGHRKESL